MGGNSVSQLDAVHLDALREIGNIGIGNALTSLAQLLGGKVTMGVPRATFLPLEEIIEGIGGYEELVSCVYMQVTGDVPGTVLFVFDERSTYRLVDLLTGQAPGTTAGLDEMGASAVREVGNILSGAFVGAIETMTGLAVRTGVPMLGFDMLGAVLSTSVIAAGYTEDQVLLIETVMVREGGEEIRGHFFLLTQPEVLDRLFAALELGS